MKETVTIYILRGEGIDPRTGTYHWSAELPQRNGTTKKVIVHADDPHTANWIIKRDYLS